jgi:hypothetical protein
VKLAWEEIKWRLHLLRVRPWQWVEAWMMGRRFKKELPLLGVDVDKELKKARKLLEKYEK